MTELSQEPTITRYTQRSSGRYVVWSNGVIERWHRNLGAWRNGDHKKQVAAAQRTANVPPPTLLRYEGETPIKALNKNFPSGAKYQFKNGTVNVYAEDLAVFLADENFKIIERLT